MVNRFSIPVKCFSQGIPAPLRIHRITDTPGYHQARIKIAIEAISYLGDQEVDLVLTEISMPGDTGVELFKAILRRPIFIFITGTGEYAAESYDPEVFDYIVKPYPHERLLKVRIKVRSALSAGVGKKAKQTGHFILKEYSRNHLIPYDQIQYVKGEKEYVAYLEIL